MGVCKYKAPSATNNSTILDNRVPGILPLSADVLLGIVNKEVQNKKAMFSGKDEIRNAG